MIEARDIFSFLFFLNVLQLLTKKQTRRAKALTLKTKKTWQTGQQEVRRGRGVKIATTWWGVISGDFHI